MLVFTYIVSRNFRAVGECSGYRMHIQIDKNAPVPLYRHTVANVRRLIDAGLLATGTRSPHYRKISRKLYANMANKQLCIAFSGS